MKRRYRTLWLQIIVHIRSVMLCKLEKSRHALRLGRRSEKRCNFRSLSFVTIVLFAILNFYFGAEEAFDLTNNYGPNPAMRVSFEDIEWSMNAGNFALWTYPHVPPSTIGVRDDERLICAYSPCRQYARARNITSYSLNMAKILSLASELSSEQAKSFSRFVDDQYWFKIQHKLDFPHHVQSVAFLLLAAIKEEGASTFCIRPLGHDTLSCEKDSAERNEYDPTSREPLKSIPPFAVSGLDLNSTRFGVLSYDGRVSVTQVANSGDEMQGFSGLQFLPYLTDFVDRDFGLPHTPTQYLFANAWWGYSSSFPPPPSLKAAWFSVHMSSSFKKITVPRNIGYFRRYSLEVGPIGARDDPTLAFLRKLGLPTYLSSCFTQMLRSSGNRYKENFSKRNLIMLVDVDENLLPAEIVALGTHFRADVNKSNIFDRQARLEHAQKLHHLYSTEAKVVITSRIHSALPASVNGVPVIFVEQSEDRLPGGKGGRTQGISNLFHTYLPENSKAWTFNLDAMPPNPGVHRQDRYRASFWNYIKRRLPKWYVDTAHLFGLVPLRRLGEGVPTPTGDIHDLFHFIFTTPAETLTWRVQRAIEAVFYHHPNARVIMHSRSLPVKGTRLDVLAETGYNFEVRPYNLNDLLAESMVVAKQDKVDLLAVLDTRKTGEFWYSHETDLIRLLIMEKYGGVYLDTDVHVVKPFPRSLQNVLAYQNKLTAKRVLKLAFAKSLNGAVMVFEKRNAFLNELITEAMNRLIRNYVPNDWGIVGPNMLSDTWRIHEKQNPGNLKVQILANDAFYPYNFGNAKSCFTGSSSHSPITEATYAVHLNTKVTSEFQATRPGSDCDMMFHSFCIFCDEIYTARSSLAWLR